ncbi:MAG: ABC transporter permease subunit/CPBP intramembrane protease [Thermoguttaceae bacterium]
MNPRNIRLIFRREMLDQFRDRRTLMMIFVVPLLLYPLIGLSFFQVSQFIQEKSSTVLVLCSEKDKHWFTEDEADAKLLAFEFKSVLAAKSESDEAEAAETLANDAIAAKKADVVLYIPNGFENYLESVRRNKLSPDSENKASKENGSKENDQKENSTKDNGAKEDDSLKNDTSIKTETLHLYYSSAFEKSTIAKSRLENLLNKLSKKIGKDNLAQLSLHESIASPIKSESSDVAQKSEHQGASFWSKMLPILLILWALTGAFYPAVDLCAGEKERGTLETLLCSPATRTEIVLGKLFTVMCFSMLTSILNIICVAATAFFLVSQLPITIALPWKSAIWMLVPLVPTSLIFSALCLALASMAKSSKEGQYYLLPLIMFVMPLVFISLAPGSELNLGTSLIPITGIVLILRRVLEGDYAAVFRYGPFVALVTLVCCYFSLRYAIKQFNRESVLFSGSQKFDLFLWLRQLRQNRGVRPSFAVAIFFAVLLLTLKYFAQLVVPVLVPDPNSASGLLISTGLLQVCVILIPAVLFAVLLTRDPVGTLGLRNTGNVLMYSFFAAVGAVLFSPINWFIGSAIQNLYPVNESVALQLQGLQEVIFSMPLVVRILFFAALPAVCEEIAFRGFILSGLFPALYRTENSSGIKLKTGAAWEPVLITAFFFGATHSIIQQSLNAGIVGCLLGFIAVRSRSVIPCIVFHFIHNALVTVGNY